jgi:serine/threonine-protein kinase
MDPSTRGDSAEYGLFDELAEEFVERFRRGERPSIQEYVDRCPGMGDEIHQLFTALAKMEEAKDQLSTKAKPEPSAAPHAFRHVGDYRVIREVGRGGMGVVYEAEQVSLGRRVALKLLPSAVAKDRKALERFRREARAAARLHHTNIVPVFEVGQDGETVYYAMQFIQGQGLDAVILELAQRRQRSLQGPAALEAPRSDRTRFPSLGTTNLERTDSQSDGAASGAWKDGDRTQAVLASLQAGQVSRMARSLETGSFAALTVAPSPVRGGDAEAPTVDEECRPADFSGETSLGLREKSEPVGVAPSAMLPGGSQVSALEPAGRRLPYFRSVAQIGRQAAQGLGYAHARGVIHRDIKPSNMLLDTSGVVWITDFGLAKADDEGLTATGDILGTLRYMAPERFRGEGDARSDVYALGLTLYELVTLEPAFRAADHLRLIEQVKSEEPPRPRTIDNRIPRDLETIVLKAIDKDARRRYVTADALAEDLRRFLDDEAILARRTTPAERYVRWARRNPWVAFLGGVLTAVLVAATAVSLVVAGQMAMLAENQRRAARDAERAQLQAEARRAEAEASHTEALAQSRIAKADFERARTAVDEFFTKVSESKLKDVPGLKALRAELLGSALAFYGELLKERADDPSLHRDLLQSRFRAGRVLHELGRDREAREVLQAARDGYEQELRDHPGDVVLEKGLAEVMFLSASIEPDLRKKGVGLNRAITLREDVLRSRPDDATNKLELADLYNSLANHYRDINAGDALSAYERSLLLKLELAEASPGDPNVVRGLGQSFNNLANLVDTENTKGQVLAMYQQATDFALEYVRLKPNDTSLANKLYVSTNNLTRILANLHRDGEAIATWQRTIGVLRAMARANPEVPEVHASCLRAAHGLASAILVRNKDEVDQAVRALIDVTDSLDHLARETAEDLAGVARMRMALAERLVTIKPALGHEEALARDEILDDALDDLRQAVAAGWKGLGEIRAAGSLASRPGYAHLLSEAEAAMAGTSSPDAAFARGDGTARAPARSFPDLRRSQAVALQAIGRARYGAGQIKAGHAAQDQSLGLFQAILRDRPTDPLALADVAACQVSIGQVLWEAGKLSEGQTAWRAACATLASFARQKVGRSPAAETALEAWQTVARTYAQHGLCKEAAGLFEQAAPLARRCLRPRVALDLYDFNAACLLLHEGDIEGYRRLCATCVQCYGSSDDSWVRLLLAWVTGLHRESGVDPAQRLRWAQAAEASLQGEYLHPLSEVVLGLAYFRAGQWDLAKHRIHEAEKSFPGSPSQPSNWAIRAMIALATGKRDEALSCLDRVESCLARMRSPVQTASDLTLLPPDRPGEGSFWRHPIVWHEWFQMETLCAEAIRLIRNSPSTQLAEDRIVRGVVTARLGDVERSDQELAQAVLEAPNAPSVWLTRSRAWRLLGRSGEAEADFEQALRIAGGSVETWISEYRWLGGRGENELAHRALCRMRSMEPRTSLEYADRALALVGTGQYKAAGEDLARAARNDMEPIESYLADPVVMDCLKRPAMERRWQDAQALVRAYRPAERTGPTTIWEAVLERIEANLMILTGDRAAFSRYARTIAGRDRDRTSETLPGELAFLCTLAQQDAVAPEVIISMANETIARRPQNEVWWQIPRICGMIRAGQYEGALRTLDDVLRIVPGWNVRMNDVLRALALHHLGREAEARHFLSVATRKAAAPVGSGSMWLVEAGRYVHDALSYTTLEHEAVRLIFDPAFPADPFAPAR